MEGMKQTNKGTGKATAEDSEAHTMPVVEEEIGVDKQVVETGSVRIIKKVEEEAVDVPLRSTFQAYSVKRIPLNRYVNEAPPAIRREGSTLIISVIEEEAVIQKRLKVVEELHLCPAETESVTNEEVKLRKERVEVERRKVNK
jgi:stress response protein YsnF